MLIIIIIIIIYVYSYFPDLKCNNIITAKLNLLHLIYLNLYLWYFMKQRKAEHLMVYFRELYHIYKITNI